MIFNCISVLLASTIFINSSAGWVPPIKPDVEAEIIQSVVVEETVIDEVTEDIVEETVVADEPIEQVESTNLPLSDEDIDLIALVTMAEAEGECELGKRLVIDVILNQIDSPRFADTVSGVVYAKNAFECMWNGRINRCYVRDDIRQLVIEELQNRTDLTVYYFRAGHYHTFGTPVINVGNHYFSTN